MKARALVIRGPRDAVIEEVEVAPPGPNEVLVRTLASGISQGSELLVYRGEAGPVVDPSLPQGLSGYPVRYGYAAVGEVVAAPGGGDLVGARVFALAPHQTAFVLPAARARPLPKELPVERAVMAANVETALNVVWDSGAGLGDEVVVIGQGVVGLLITALLRAAGARVTAIEPAPVRRAAALRLGARRALSPDDPALAGLDGRADLVIEASGRPEAIDRAIALAGFEARVVLVSSYGERRWPIDLGQTFHRRRIVLVSSQVSSVATSRRARWDHDRRFALVVDLLAALPLDLLLDRRVPLDQAPEILAELDRDSGAGLQVVLDHEPVD